MNTDDQIDGQVKKMLTISNTHRGLSTEQFMLLIELSERARGLAQVEDAGGQASGWPGWIDWRPGKWAAREGRMWTPSQRSVLSRQMRRLEGRGLIVRENYIGTGEQWRTTCFQLTELGQQIALEMELAVAEARGETDNY